MKNSKDAIFLKKHGYLISLFILCGTDLVAAKAENMKTTVPGQDCHECKTQTRNRRKDYCARKTQSGFIDPSDYGNQKRTDDNCNDCIGQHIGTVVQHRIQDGCHAGIAHELFRHILGINRHAADKVNDEAGKTADKGCKRKQGILLFEETRKTDKGISYRIVEDDGDPAERAAGGKEILQCSKDQTGADAPAEPPANRKDDQGDHDKIDASPESAESGHNRDFQIA